MQDRFLIDSKWAEYLYFEVARDLPLIDYHNHLNYADIAAGKTYTDMTDAWLLCDGYKHRAMRICGVDEALITGNASHKDKFAAWCETVPKLYGGPLYDWSRIELRDIFGISLGINGANAEAIWEQANEKLASPQFSARGLYDRFDIAYAAPCTELQASLEAFEKVDSMAPSLRGDNLLMPSRELVTYLSGCGGVDIRNLEDYLAAMVHRLDAFARVGCRFSDHSLDNGFRYERNAAAAERIFQNLLAGEPVTAEERVILNSEMLLRLAGEYARRGWTLQLHMGSQRSTSTRIRNLPGACGGFAAIGNAIDLNSLVAMLDDMEQGVYGLPPKVIIYNLNPNDNAMIGILSGSFIGVTQGPAWWWCDHIQGMREMLDHFAVYSVLSTFVGMNTDSRSLLSLSRHDYFRRVFCGWIGKKVEQGELPWEKDVLTGITRAVCYENARRLIK